MKELSSIVLKYSKLIIYFCLLVLPIMGVSQSFEWIQSNSINYAFNPSYPEHTIDYDHQNHRIIHSRLDSFALIYGQSLLGKYAIDCRDTNGVLLWTVALGSNAIVQRLVVDHSGDIYVGGQFQQTFIIGQTDSLTFIPTVFSMNFFLLKLNSQGALLWKRNLTASWPNYDGLEAMAIDPLNKCWYAFTDFFVAKIVMVDANGNDTFIHTVNNAKRIGNISFDFFGGMYMSGAAQQGAFQMNASMFNAPHDYNMFIARFDPSGNPSWVHFGADVTFQKPMVTVDPMGNALYAGSRFDSTSFNGAYFSNPYFLADFFVFKMDSAGNVLWTVKQPPLLIGPFGSFETGSNLFIDTDASGKLYLGGLQHGLVDWGNSYVSVSVNPINRETAIACINESGNTNWVKLGGSNSSNYMHSLTVSDGGSCYFTGSFRDTATFDNLFIPTNSDYNFLLGKIRNLSSGIDEDSNDLSFNIYPNPTSEWLYLTGISNSEDFYISDLTGRIILNIKLQENRMLDVSNLQNGIYFLHVKSGLRKTIRFVKSGD